MKERIKIKKENKITVILLMIIAFLIVISFSKVSFKTQYITFYVFGEEYAQIEKNHDITLPNDPVYVGYRFEGWYIDEEFEIRLDILNINNISEVYAKLVEAYNTVIFDSNGGEFLYEFMIVDNNDILDITMFEEPYKKNHGFLGWYLEGQLFNFKTPITNDIILVAMWDLLQYEVRLDANGGYLSENIILIGVNGLLDELPIPTKENHIFLGWYEVVNGIESLEEFDLNFIPQSDINLVAKWLHVGIISFQNTELLKWDFEELQLSVGVNIKEFVELLIEAYNNDLTFQNMNFFHINGVEIKGYTILNMVNGSYLSEKGAVVIFDISVYDGNFEYEITENEVSIIGYNGVSQYLELPLKYRGLKVTRINNYALANKQLKEVVFSSYIKYIEEGAFSNNKITTIEIDGLEFLEYIGKRAFENNLLNEIILRNLSSLNLIEQRSFARNNILSITLDDLPNIEIINNDAFLENNNISRVDILGKTQRFVEDNVYWWYNRHQIFNTSSDLNYFGIEITIEIIFENVMINNSNKITINNTAFQYVDSIIIALLNKYNKDIESLEAFNNLVFVMGVEIKGIHSGDGINLIDINNHNYELYDGVLRLYVIEEIYSNDIRYEIIDNEIQIAYRSNWRDTELIIPSSIKGLKVTQIMEDAFNSNFIENVFLPNTIEVIGNSSFGSNNISDFSFENLTNLRIIGEYAFNGNKLNKLELIGLPIEEIGEFAFGENILEEVIIKDLDKLKRLDINIFSFQVSAINIKIENLISLKEIYLRYNKSFVIFSGILISDCPQLSQIDNRLFFGGDFKVIEFNNLPSILELSDGFFESANIYEFRIMNMSKDLLVSNNLLGNFGKVEVVSTNMYDSMWWHLKEVIFPDSQYIIL